MRLMRLARLRRILRLLILCSCGGFFAPGLASAGVYEVRSCAASSALRTTAWVPSTIGNSVRTDDWCLSEQSDFDSDPEVDFSRALFVTTVLPRVGPSSSPVPQTVASLTMGAPAGGTIRAITYHRRLLSIDESWVVRLMADQDVLESCEITGSELRCGDQSPDGVFTGATPSGTQVLKVSVACTMSGCHGAQRDLFTNSLPSSTPPSSRLKRASRRA